MTYVCELHVGAECEYLADDGHHCRGNCCCAFCEEENRQAKEKYVRKERWYEKYYK